MSKCKKNRKRFDEINVIPFIDIMLVLLVIVLTTATFIKQGIIPIELPNASQSDKKSNKKEIVIFVDKEGKLFLDKKQISLNNLELKLKTIEKSQSIVLKSDKNSRFQDFISIMNILKKLRHEEFYIVTQE